MHQWQLQWKVFRKKKGHRLDPPHDKRTPAQVMRKVKWNSVQISKMIRNILVQANNIQKKNHEELKAQFQSMYAWQIERRRPKLSKKSKTPVFTFHASFRIWERTGYTKEQIIQDIKKWWRWVKAQPGGKLKVYGTRGKYIITKDFIVITMYPHDRTTTVRDASEENKSGQEGEPQS